MSSWDDSWDKLFFFFFNKRSSFYIENWKRKGKMNHSLKMKQATLWNSSAGKGDFSSFKGTSFPVSGNHLLIISFYEIIFEIETLCIMTFSPHTLLFKFQKTLYLITTTYYLLPFTKYSWQRLETDIFTWK